MLQPNFLLRIVVGLCVGSSVVAGTVLAGDRAIPVASGGDLQAQVKATAAKVTPAVVSIGSTVIVRDQAFSDEGLPFGLVKDAPPPPSIWSGLRRDCVTGRLYSDE